MFKKLALGVALCALVLAGPAAAFQPEEALSAQPSDSIYIAARIDNLGNFLRWILSDKNLALVGPAMGDEDGLMTELVSMAAAGIPAQSMAFLGGINAKGMPCVQLAIALPDNLKPQLTRVAEGKAQADDVLALLLGKGNPVAEMFGDMIQVQAGNGMVVINEVIYATAKDNLFLLGVTLDDLKAELAALNGKNRLRLKRKTDTRDYLFSHIDLVLSEQLTLANFEGEGDDLESLKNAYEQLKEVCVAPMEVELGFKALADKFSVMTVVNLRECINPKYLSEPSAPVKGGGVKLFGEGSPLFALGSVMKGDIDDFKKFALPEDITESITSVIEMLNSIGLSKKTLSEFLTGEFSLVASGKVDFAGSKLPGVALTQKGHNGTAAKVFDVIAAVGEDELTPINVAGFDRALQGDIAAAQISAIIGLNDDALSVCVMDDPTQTPTPSAQVRELLGKDSYTTLMIDFEAIRAFLANPDNNIGALLDMFGEEGFGSMLEMLLDVDLSVPFMSMWGPKIGTLYIDFNLKDVAPERGVWAKIIQFMF